MEYTQFYTAVSQLVGKLRRVFSGASASQDGAAGMVPQPLKTDLKKFLSADGAWRHESFRGQHDAANAYTAFSTVTINGILAKCSVDIAANTVFAWGVSGSAWQPLIEPGLTYAGNYSGTATYTAGQVVTVSNSQGLLYKSILAGNTGKAITDTSAWVPYNPTLDFAAAVKNVIDGLGIGNLAATAQVIKSKMLIEKAQISTGVITGNPSLTLELENGLVLVHSTAAASDWTINAVSLATKTLAASLGVGECVTFTHLIKMGGVSYMPKGVSVDGQLITETWLGGSKPTAGIANCWNCYSYSIIRLDTTATGYLVMCDQSSFS